jgi:N-methylhydantoinase B
MASGCGLLPVMELNGVDQRGTRFGVPLLDIGLSTGYGAWSDADGIDSGGTLGNPFSSIANVETYEYRYPILYLWRRHEQDSGGLGRFRGGQGVSLAFTPHHPGAPLEVVLHGLGCAVPSTLGLSGGNPGATNTFVVIKGSTIEDDLRGGVIPGEASQVKGDFQPMPGLAKLFLDPGDVLVATNNGGGGFGDPLDRDITLVENDVVRNAVSQEWAKRGYGVVLKEGLRDAEATAILRDNLRVARLVDGRTMAVAEVSCPHCQHIAKEVVETRLPLVSLGRNLLPYQENTQFESAHQFCGNCGSVLSVVLTERKTTGG